MVRGSLVLLVLAPFVLVLSGSVAAQAEPAPIAIEVAGTVPGFTKPALEELLARRMQETAGPHWRFAAAEGLEASAASRVVWSFKTLREVWKGGSHSGFPSPSHAETFLSTEAKLYLDGVYQMTMSTEPTLYRGAEDGALADMTRKVAQAMFVENKP
jgi:hypothetical protein